MQHQGSTTAPHGTMSQPQRPRPPPVASGEQLPTPPTTTTSSPMGPSTQPLTSAQQTATLTPRTPVTTATNAAPTSAQQTVVSITRIVLGNFCVYFAACAMARWNVATGGTHTTEFSSDSG